MAEAKWRRRECVSAELEGALVLLDLETLKYHSLNTTASAVWEILAQPRTKSEVVHELCKRYSVSQAHCQVSVDGLLSDMERRQLVLEEADVPVAAV